jgi:hypothetical protein
MTLISLRAILWLHTLAAGAFGLALYLAPAAAGATWPWPLPPLAARFVGSLLLAAALDSGMAAAARDEQPFAGVLLMGSVLYGLIALAGVLAVPVVGSTSGLLVAIALFGAVALASAALFALRMGVPQAGTTLRSQTRFLRGLLTLDLLLVAPVGLAMYVAPEVARRFWPWDLPPLNVRLIGSIFVATMIVSFWALRQQSWEQVRPSVAAGGAFATLALIASFLHFDLFDPARPVTWLFIALYTIVALGAWLVLAQYAAAQREEAQAR